MTETLPVAHLGVEFDIDEVRLQATNVAEDKRFRAKCKNGPEHIEWTYHCTEEQQEREYSGTAVGNFVVESMSILIHFLRILGSDAEIGEFLAGFRHPRILEVNQFQLDFLERLILYLETRHPLYPKVGRFVIQHDGMEYIASTLGISTFLENLRLIGEEVLVCRSSADVVDWRELHLNGLYRMEARMKPKKLEVTGRFWTRVNCIEWAKFRHITTTCPVLTNETALALMEVSPAPTVTLILLEFQKFIVSPIFKSCSITVLEVDAYFQMVFNIHPNLERLPGAVGEIIWKVREVNFQLSFFAQSNLYVFRKLD